MTQSYEHTLRYNEFANQRPLFQNYVETIGRESNLNRTSKRYYSSQDVSIYFGDFFIEDAASVQYSVTESAMLLYGYNSYVFDDIAKGSRMVQGQFSIHFTHANYLFKVLSDISQYKGTGLITHSRYHALWPIGFDLLIHHGSKQHSNPVSDDLQTTVLKDIYITGASTIYDSRSGEPIQEVYTFVGRDILFGVELDNKPVEEPEIIQTSPHIQSVKFVPYTDDQIIVILSEKAFLKHIGYAFGQDNLTFNSLKFNSDEAMQEFIINVDRKIVSNWIDGKVVIHLNLNYRDYEPESYSTILALK